MVSQEAGEQTASGAEEEEEEKVEQPSKSSRITDSCIHGVAQPHKPRIGKAYQAVVPEWKGPPPK